MSGLYWCFAIITMIFSAFALICAIVMTALFNNQLKALADATCIATQGNEEIDVAANFRFVSDFGFRLYLTLTCFMVLSFFSWAHLCLASINICSKICMTQPMTILLICQGVYLFSWSGE